MKAAVFEKFGDPAEVLHVRDVPIPEPKPGQVRVRMLACPINPSDLLTVTGQYGRHPRLPATPGYEGVGIVEKSGGGVLGWLALGKRVAVLNGLGGNWAEYAVIPATNAVRVPAGLTDEQVASFFVNPATVVAMASKVLRVPPGEWLLQTAAASALGRMMIRYARHEGFRTINVVRRREAAEELLRMGADVVINSTERKIEDGVHEATQGSGVKYAIDAVGGETGSAVVRSLGAGGRMLVYGTLALEPLQFDQRVLIAGSKRLEGFWLSEWVARQSKIRMVRLFRKLGKLIAAGVLATEVGTTFPLDQIQAAVQQAAQPGRAGKVLLKITS